MDPDSKPNGPKDKEGVGTCRCMAAGGRLLEAMGTGGTRVKLLDNGGDLGKERSDGGRNILSGNKVKCSCLEHGSGQVAHKGTGL
jgi:hypothetical protein